MEDLDTRIRTAPTHLSVSTAKGLDISLAIVQNRKTQKLETRNVKKLAIRCTLCGCSPTRNVVKLPDHRSGAGQRGSYDRIRDKKKKKKEEGAAAKEKRMEKKVISLRKKELQHHRDKRRVRIDR